MKNILFTLFAMIASIGSSATLTPEYLYKIVSPEDWQAAQEQAYLKRGAIDTDFIHLATKEQLPRIAEKFWKNKDYVILKLDPKKLTGRLVYEANPGGSTLFYHLYDGEIPREAVIEATKR